MTDSDQNRKRRRLSRDVAREGPRTRATPTRRDVLRNWKLCVSVCAYVRECVCACVRAYVRAIDRQTGCSKRRNSTVLQTDAQLQSDRYPSPNKSRSHRLQINNVKPRSNNNNISLPTAEKGVAPKRRRNPLRPGGCRHPLWRSKFKKHPMEMQLHKRKRTKNDRPREGPTFFVIAPPTQTYFPNNVRNRPDILDIALMRRVALNVRCIETLQNLNSDHRPVLLKIGPPDGEQPPKNKTITSWRKVSLLLEETDTPILNNIPDNIETTDEIDYAIGALTNHIGTVIEDSSREVPAADSRRKLPEDVRVLLKAKNAAMRRASAYPTCENRSCARALQRKVKARMQEFKNVKWSTLMEEITPSHQAYWKLAKALKSDGYLPTPALRKPDNTFAVDDREKAECLADSIEQQCSNNTIHDATHSHRIEEEVRTKIALEPQDDLAPVSVDEIQKHIKALKTKKAPGLDGISNKAIKCFSLPLMALLVAIFNACFKNCYFPPIWKEAVVIGLPKPGKPRDLPASYRPISLLSGLGKLFEKTIKTRLSEHLMGKGLIINEQFGFRPNHSCPSKSIG
ncbi:Probable RNA-directed DNA polymerase from transposon BS [Eumeta japonica]|uniref:Probable RNA-directed DNA polymerase from transposon BS n=1 Tax=Eumeta variegata TaxID=151549 RepID=A0A4C1WX80_EUMVA|nr:Probable RNA-directed DNA polymerase from transposon BS [Eumeta japonica]